MTEERRGRSIRRDRRPAGRPRGVRVPIAGVVLILLAVLAGSGARVTGASAAPDARPNGGPGEAAAQSAERPQAMPASLAGDTARGARNPRPPPGRIGLATTAWAATPQERWLDVAGYFDMVMGGNPRMFQRMAEVRPDGTRMPYALLWTVPPPEYSRPGISSVFEQDMFEWYSRRPDCIREDAYLHEARPASPATRMRTPIVEGNPWWGEHRYSIMNPADECFLEYTADRFNRLMERQNGNGVFVDVHDHGTIRWMRGSVELPEDAELHEAIVRFYERLRPMIGGAPVFLNTATYLIPQTGEWIARAAAAAGGTHMESVVVPAMRARQVWESIDHFAREGAVVKPTTNFSMNNWETSRTLTDQGFTAGNHTSRAARGMMCSLACVYQADSHFYSAEHTMRYAPWKRTVGAPLGERHVLHSQTDGGDQPSDVWAREFEHALLLCRPPRSDWRHTDYSERTVFEVPLPDPGPGRAWCPVRDDDSLAPPARSITLRNVEGAMLARCTSGGVPTGPSGATTARWRSGTGTRWATRCARHGSPASAWSSGSASRSSGTSGR